MSGSKATAFVVALAGLGVIYKLQLEPSQFLAAASTVAAGVMGAVGVTLSKKLSNNYSEIQIIAGYLTAMIVVNPVFSFLAGESMPVPALTMPWLAQLGYAASYLIANTAVVAGFRHLDPSVGALVGLLEVIFAAIFGIIVFGEELTIQLIVGGGLILTAMSLPDAAKLLNRR